MQKPIPPISIRLDAGRRTSIGFNLRQDALMLIHPHPRVCSGSFQQNVEQDPGYATVFRRLLSRKCLTNSRRKVLNPVSFPEFSIPLSGFSISDRARLLTFSPAKYPRKPRHLAVSRGRFRRVRLPAMREPRRFLPKNTPHARDRRSCRRRVRLRTMELGRGCRRL